MNYQPPKGTVTPHYYWACTVPHCIQEKTFDPEDIFWHPVNERWLCRECLEHADMEGIDLDSLVSLKRYLAAAQPNVEEAKRLLNRSIDSAGKLAGDIRYYIGPDITNWHNEYQTLLSVVSDALSALSGEGENKRTCSECNMVYDTYEHHGPTCSGACERAFQDRKRAEAPEPTPEEIAAGGCCWTVGEDA